MKKKMVRDPIKMRISSAKWVKNNPEKNKISYTKSKRKKLIAEPWYRLFQAASSRCYARRSNYYKRGIKMLLSPEDLKMMWFRDNAPMMEHPSLDRIDSTGNYTLGNTRIIEYKENLRLAAENRKLKILGKVFGKLTVIEYLYLKNGKTYWTCKCSCGNTKETRGVYLTRGVTRSCGCLRWGEKKETPVKQELSG